MHVCPHNSRSALQLPSFTNFFFHFCSFNFQITFRWNIFILPSPVILPLSANTFFPSLCTPQSLCISLSVFRDIIPIYPRNANSRIHLYVWACISAGILRCADLCLGLAISTEVHNDILSRHTDWPFFILVSVSLIVLPSVSSEFYMFCSVIIPTILPILKL